MRTVEGKLTCPQPNPQTTNEVVVQSVMITDCDFNTGLSEVFWLEAVIHHDEVEHRVGCPLNYPGLLLAFSASVRKHVAATEGNDQEIHLFIQTDLTKTKTKKTNYHFTNGSIMTPLTGGRFLQFFTQICTSLVSFLDVLLPVYAVRPQLVTKLKSQT